MLSRDCSSRLVHVRSQRIFTAEQCSQQQVGADYEAVCMHVHCSSSKVELRSAPRLLSRTHVAASSASSSR
jgi:hypothetical protein